MRVGVQVILDAQTDIREKFAQVRQMGMCSCQLVTWDRQVFRIPELAEQIVAAQREFGVDITAFWCGWEGRKVWDSFTDGPLTLGLVPADYRVDRLHMLMEGSDFAKKLGVTALATHVGYLPETPSDPKYREVLNACITVTEYCNQNGQAFLFETGQETPVTLLRMLQDIEKLLPGCQVGINLDPANLIMYGKANPVDALEVIGKYVRGVHGKDGCYPTDGYHLGREVRLGDGRVNYPVFIRRLQEAGYDGDITIEREISGQQQRDDILIAKELLEKLIAERKIS